MKRQTDFSAIFVNVFLLIFQVSLLLFSKWDDPSKSNYMKEDDKTKLVIPFSDGLNAEMFERFINITNYTDVEGGHTRTDKALQIADEVVSKKHIAHDKKNQFQ
jgi:hypothetical protein